MTHRDNSISQHSGFEQGEFAMALIRCDECGSQVSDKAKQCPKCACPIQAVTIERTSKNLKKQGCIAGLVMILGIILIGISGFPFQTKAFPEIFQSLGTLIILIGIIMAVVNRLKIWWHHE
jgi:uncharacterized membrane protein YvbJ